MHDPSSLLKLFKHERNQLEKLRVLDFSLPDATDEERPAIRRRIDAVVDEIEQLGKAIRDQNLRGLSATYI